MKDFSELLSIAFLLASERGATVQEIAERFGYSSRSSIYSDFGNIYKHFGMVVEATEERREKRPYRKRGCPAHKQE